MERTGNRSCETRRFCAALCALSAVFPATAFAGEKGWDDASDIGRGVLVAAALGIPVVKGDAKGVLQAGASMGATKLVTDGLKDTFPETRPDGSDRRSFPSGHTSLSFAGAATLQNRYGWKVGVPAQLVAGFVGFARIQADKHYWYDVLVGAAIGEASGFLITSRANDSVRVMPWGDTNGAGVVVSARF